MKIQILGIGCPKCRALAANVKKAVDELGAEIEIEKIEDIKEIMKFNLMLTPGLAIDGSLKASGKALSLEEIKKLISAAGAQ